MTKLERHALFFLATVALATSWFIGGTRAGDTLRDPVTLGVVAAMIGSLLAVLFLGA